MKKKLIISLIVVLSAGTVCAAFAHQKYFNKTNAYSAPEYAQAIRGVVDRNDVGYISLLDDDKMIEVEDVDELWLTPDRAKIIVLDTDSKLYWMDAESKEKEDIAEDVEGIWGISDKQLIFGVGDRTISYLYDTKKSYEVDELSTDSVGGGAIVQSEGNKNILYNLDTEEGDYTEIYKSKKEIDIVTVNSNKNNLVWCEHDDNYTVNLTEAGETTEIFEIKGDSDFPIYSIQEQCIYDDCCGVYMADYEVLYDGDDTNCSRKEEKLVNTIYYLDENKDCTPIELNGMCLTVFTNKMYIGNATQPENEYYVVTQDVDDYLKADKRSKDDSDKKSHPATLNLEYFNKKGDTKVLLKDARYCYVNDGHVYFVTKDNHLVEAKIAGDKLKKYRVIDEDVRALSPFGLDGNVFYMKDGVDEECFNLYAYHQGKEAKRIAKNIISTYDNDSNSAMALNPNGDTVYFYKDCYRAEYNDSVELGCLCKYTYGDDEYTEIDDNVIVDSIEYPSYSLYHSDEFTYQIHTDSDWDRVIFTYCYYDGDKHHYLKKKIRIND